MKKALLVLLKISIMALIFYHLYTKVDVNEIVNYLSRINVFHLTVAFISFNFSYNISALRLKDYIESHGVKASYKSCLNLFYRSSMVSNFLPGGVGGEGYKLYILNKIYLFSVFDSFKIVLSDRGSGMLALAVLVLSLLPFASYKIEFIAKYIWLIAALGMLVNLYLYRYVTREYLGENLKLSLYALFKSILVQILCYIGFYMVISDIMPNVSLIEYAIVFFISSAALIFPVSIGGIGIREISMVYSAYIFPIDAELAIAASIIYYMISLVSSMIIGGVFFTKKIS
ncbi:MAG: flippase-like domain-containing protein [Alphaproteobacteria bacterium]|nr:flippase-like domain-containing protein [Alphaproteobacteria bacterium]OJV15712.1 MAG: hypothetical protein BGO27_07330 [Alphaproteobacteria bacterium 33-17]